MDAPELGIGMMYLPGLDHVLEAGEDLFDLVETEPQTLAHHEQGRLSLRQGPVDALRASSKPILVHGVGAPVGGSVVRWDLLNPFYEAIETFDPPWVSEHLTFNAFDTGGTVQLTGFMLPPLQVDAAVQIAASNIEAIRERVSAPFLFETPVNYLRPHPSEMSDGSFVAEVAQRADCGILLDLHNVWCNEQNGRQSVVDAVAEMPLDRIWEVHLAAGREVDGYWVDAHSGLIEEPVWELAEEVIPRLPSLKAIVFETMPEYLWVDDVGPDQVAAQFERLRELWGRRGSRMSHVAPGALSSSRKRPGAAGEPLVRERTLGRMVASALEDEGSDAGLANDPGVAIYARLARSVRVGVVADTLRLSYRLISLARGDDYADDLLQRYARETPVRAVSADEARQFSRWVGASQLGIDHLEEVLEFELAGLDVLAMNEARTIRFSCDPRELLSALGAGRLPRSSTQGSYSLELTP